MSSVVTRWRSWRTRSTLVSTVTWRDDIHIFRVPSTRWWVLHMRRKVGRRWVLVRRTFIEGSGIGMVRNWVGPMSVLWSVSSTVGSTALDMCWCTHGSRSNRVWSSKDVLIRTIHHGRLAGVTVHDNFYTFFFLSRSRRRVHKFHNIRGSFRSRSLLHSIVHRYRWYNLRGHVVVGCCCREKLVIRSVFNGSARATETGSD